MLRRMSSAELTEWMAFSMLEPFGGETQYLGPAITSATIANVNREKNQKEYKPADFVPQFRREEQGVNQQLQIAEMMTIALGGADLREE